jgi:hypothetical protein
VEDNIEANKDPDDTHCDATSDDDAVTPGFPEIGSPSECENSMASGEDSSSYLAVGEKSLLNRTINCSSISFVSAVLDPVVNRKTFLETTMDVFGCIPDHAVDEFSLHTMSFENPLSRDVTTTSITVPGYLDAKRTIIEQLHGISDRNVKSRVEQLIHETSSFQSPQISTSESRKSRQLHSSKMISSPSQGSSICAASTTHSHGEEEYYQVNDYPSHADTETKDEPCITSCDTDDDDNNDSTSTSISHDEFMDINDRSDYSTSTSESFYEDESTGSNTYDNDDEVSAPVEVTSMFCR